MDGHLRRLFRRNLPEAQWTSIETGSTAAGVPDCEYIFPGGYQGWVEFKAARKDRVIIRSEQVGWLLTRSRMGGRCFIAVRRDRELMIYDGGQAAELKDRGISRIGWRYYGLTPWDWAAVKQLLIQK